MQAITPDNNLLAPFRRRIRLLRLWRCSAIGGAMGAAVSLVVATIDYLSIHYTEKGAIAVPVLCGMALGACRALFEKLPDDMVARSVDRRGHLEDRLATLMTVAPTGNGFTDALRQDATRNLSSLRSKDLYPVRFSRWHGALLLLVALAALVFLMGNSPILRSPQGKKDMAEMQAAAAEVQRVAKPILERAKEKDATDVDKDLARRLDKFSQELNKARMTRQESLIKANQLAEDVRKLENSRMESLAQSLAGAKTASEQLEKMAEQAKLQKSDAAKLAEQIAREQRSVGEMEQKLAEQAKSGEKGKEGQLSEEERKALEKKLAEAKKRLQELKLSQRAQDFLAKLHSMKDYQEAQKLLQQLAQNAGAQQDGSPSELTPEQIQAMAERLEALAKEMDSEEKMKELAKKLLEAAKNARMCKSGHCSGGLLGAFGLGMSAGGSNSSSSQRGPGGLSLGGSKGAGGPSDDKWVGAHGELNKSDKSSLLNVKFSDRVLTSQIGDKGSQSYVDIIGPVSSGGKTSIPYQKVLPQYEKSAESVLKKSDIPPRLRTKVRDYFDSLHK